MAYLITENCSGCTACAHICPTGAIAGEKEDRHQIEEQTCIDCGACGKVCPDAAVQDAFGSQVPRIKRSEWQKPFFDKQKCNGCAICLDVCPTDCIALGVPAIKDLHAYPEIADPKACIGCGFCDQECPVDAIEMAVSPVIEEKIKEQKAQQERSMGWLLKKFSFRVIQKILKGLTIILPIPIPTVLNGPGCVANLAENIKARGISNVLVVTDKSLMGMGLLDGMLESLNDKEIQFTIFDSVPPDPTVENVEAGKEIYNSNKCKGIIGFGGGSPMDCAKIIGARVRNPYLPVRWMKGVLKVMIPIPPLFCVPTTAGTGSEATMVGVIKNATTHEKNLIIDPRIVPKIAALDPELMIGLPQHITSHTGMDALSHVVESYISKSGNPYSDKNNKIAIKLIFENLEMAYNDGANLEARNNMALAAFYAGTAFTRVSAGYVHAIAHNIGGLYGVPHGLANAVIMPYVLEYSRKKSEKKLAALAIAGGIGSNADSDEALSHRFIDKVKSMNANMNIPTYFEELKESDIRLIVKRALKEAHPLYAVPRIMTEQDCADLVRKLLPGS